MGSIPCGALVSCVIFVAGKFWFPWRLRLRGIAGVVHSCVRWHRACVSSVNHDKYDNNDEKHQVQQSQQDLARESPACLQERVWRACKTEAGSIGCSSGDEGKNVSAGWKFGHVL